jgi:hypothetical protein
MGYYVNPQDGRTKEEFLAERGREVTRDVILRDAFKDKSHTPVVMVDNGFFTAAAIAFDARELKAFTDLDDVRPHRYFFVPREELREWYP